MAASDPQAKRAPYGHDVKIRLEGPGKGTVELNGAPINFVRAVRFEAKVGELTTVHLELIAQSVEVEAPGSTVTTELFKGPDSTLEKP